MIIPHSCLEVLKVGPKLYDMHLGTNLWLLRENLGIVKALLIVSCCAESGDYGMCVSLFLFNLM